jgi:hypothetical protein
MFFRWICSPKINTQVFLLSVVFLQGVVMLSSSSSSSSHGGSGGIDPSIFNSSPEVAKQKLEETKPSKIVKIFGEAVARPNEGHSKQVAFWAAEKIIHVLRSSDSPDLLQKAGQAFKQFLDTSLTKFHNNSLDEDEAKLVGIILKDGPVASTQFDLLYKAAQFKRAMYILFHR